jgi:hypothetical protein
LEYSSGFITSISREDVLNKIYSERKYFVELRRDWSRGLRLIFMRKTSTTDYSFIGSGIITGIVNPDRLNPYEKALCIKNNYYGKITFAQLTKYIPGINVKLIVRRNWKSFALLHGAYLSSSEVKNIDYLSKESIVS